MDKCTIIRQVSEQKLREGLMKPKMKRSKSNFKQPPSYTGTSSSSIYSQPPSFSNKNSSFNNHTFQKNKKIPSRRGRFVQNDEDDIGTDLPIIPRKNSGSDSTCSVTTATTVLSGLSYVSSSSSHCKTGSNIYNSSTSESFVMKSKEFCTADDASITTATTCADTFIDDFDTQSYQSNNHSLRRLLSTMSTDSLLILENEEDQSSDEFTVYCDKVEEDIISPSKDNEDETPKVCTNNRRKNFILHRRRR